MKYETDRVGFQILLENFVAQRKQQKNFIAPIYRYIKFHGYLKFFHYEFQKVTWYNSTRLENMLLVKDSMLESAL